MFVRAARVFDGHTLHRDAAVGVEDGRITAVCRASDVLPSASASGVEVLDLADRTLLPGLIDAHVHFTFSAAEGAMHDIIRDDERTLVLRAVGHAELALRSGVTTVRDCGDRGNVTLAVRDAIAGGLIRGPRVLACGMPLTTTAGHCHTFGLEADAQEELVRGVRRQVKAGVDGIKIMATGGRLTPGSNPSQPQYTTAQLATVVSDAHRLGKRVAAHVLGTEGIRRAVAAGVDTLEHLSWIGDSDEDRVYDPDTVEAIKARGLWGSVTNGHSLREHAFLLGKEVSLTPAERRSLDIYALQLDLIDRMYRQGMPMLVTDDAGVPNVTVAGFPFALASLCARTSIAPIDALRMATANAAAALGLDSEVGTIEPGKRADLLAVDGNPTEQPEDLTRTAFVFKEGRVVCAEGRLL